MKRISDYKDDGDDHSSNNNNKSSTYRYICTTKELPPTGISKQFSINNEKGTKKIQIAVFNVDGKYYCISNKCQHQGGPLSKGILDEEKKVVTCPWHGWKYSIIDGKAPHKGGDSVDSYEIRVVKDKLYVNSIPNNIGSRVTQPHKGDSFSFSITIICCCISCFLITIDLILSVYFPIFLFLYIYLNINCAYVYARFLQYLLPSIYWLYSEDSFYI